MTDRGRLSLEAWKLVRQMLDDMTATIEADAETELELVEGLRVLGRITALCSELSLDVDAREAVLLRDEHRSAPGRRRQSRRRVPARDDRRPPPLPRARPTGNDRVSRLPGARGHGPRPRGAWPRTCPTATSNVRADGTFAFVFAADEADAAELAGDAWVAIPEDASSIVVREYIADRANETLADFTIEPLDAPRRPAAPDRRGHRRAADEHGVDDRQARRRCTGP